MADNHGSTLDLDRVYIDVETTGTDIDTAEIVEIAILRETAQGKIVSTFYSRVRPAIEPGPDSFLVQRGLYRSADWTDAPVFADIAQEVHKMVENSYIVGHNVHFDRYMLWRELRRSGMQDRIGLVPYRLVDTLTLAFVHTPFLGKTTLNTLRGYFDISTDKAHEALADVQDTRTIYRRLSNPWSRLYWRGRHWLRSYFGRLIPNPAKN